MSHWLLDGAGVLHADSHLWLAGVRCIMYCSAEAQLELQIALSSPLYCQMTDMNGQCQP